ncbi:MAG: tetratricopeptide repeat protein [Bdellovibrionales bacterium]
MEASAFNESTESITKNQIAMLKELAEEGEAEMQLELGKLYFNGHKKENIERDYKRAEYWIKKAALQELPNAQLLLCFFYMNLPEMRNYESAIGWCKKAASHNFTIAYTKLGWLYTMGYGVPKDSYEGAKWFLKGALSGEAVAQENLGRSYYKGEGVKKDLVKAYFWMNFTKAPISKEKEAGIELLKKQMTASQIKEAELLLKGLEETGRYPDVKPDDK